MTDLPSVLLAVFCLLTPVIMGVIVWRDEREIERKFFNRKD